MLWLVLLFEVDVLGRDAAYWSEWTSDPGWLSTYEDRGTLKPTDKRHAVLQQPSESDATCHVRVGIDGTGQVVMAQPEAPLEACPEPNMAASVAAAEHFAFGPTPPTDDGRSGSTVLTFRFKEGKAKGVWDRKAHWGPAQLLSRSEPPVCAAAPFEPYTCDLTLDVDERGRVTDHQLGQGCMGACGPVYEGAFDDWRFAPEVRDGQPVASQVEIRIHYPNARQRQAEE